MASQEGEAQASGQARRSEPAVLVALSIVLLAGCAGPAPVLYPNEQLRAVGQAQADQDIAECRELAEQAGASEGSGTRGTAGRTVAGGAIGGAVGAAGGERRELTAEEVGHRREAYR